MKTSRRRHRSGEESPHQSKSRKRDRNSPDRSNRRRERDEDNHRRDHKHDKKEKHFKSDKSSNSEIRNIKNEAEFDRRHEELSRKRKNRMNYEVKKERQDNDQADRNRTFKSEHERYGKPEHNQEEEKPIDKEKPNLGLSGALTEDTNTYRGVVIKYNEPPEARKPTKRWRLYPFKGDEQLKVLHMHRQSGYLIGKLRHVVDIPVDHPSCSKQHAVFQFRLVTEKFDGKTIKKIKPYIIDLESTNGTYVNNNRIEPRRYVELKEQDVLKFGFSSREYVLLHEKSDTSNYADDSESE